MSNTGNMDPGQSQRMLKSRAQYDIGCCVEVQGIEKEFNRGTVLTPFCWEGTPMVILKMEISNNAYADKIDKKYHELYPPDVPRENVYITKLQDVMKVERNLEHGAFQRDEGDVPQWDHQATETRDASATNPAVKPTQSGSDEDIDKDMGEMYKKIVTVADEVVYVRNTLLYQMKEDICKTFRNDLNKNSIRDKEYLGKVVKENQVKREYLEDQVMALQAQMKTLEEKWQRQVKAMENKHQKVHFGMIIFIIMHLIGWNISEMLLNNNPITEQVKTADANIQDIPDKFFEQSIKEKLGTFDSTMSTIQSNFPDEEGRFWSSITAPVRRIIQDRDPSRPAVVLIATTKSYSTIAECLSRKVASLVENVYDLNDNSDTFITIEASDLTSLDPDEAKSQMNHDLNGNYQGRHMVAVINDLGSLPATTAVLLHAYCDHESARFKKVVLLATVYLDHGVTLSTEEVEAYLYEVWQELEEDVLKPLISRIANNIAIMETRYITNYVCET